MLFYTGLGMQLMGMASVGLCFFAGVTKGDYGQFELIELIGGAFIFYVGTFLKGKNK